MEVTNIEMKCSKTIWVIKARTNYPFLLGLFLSETGVPATLEFEDEEDNGGLVNPVGGGGWADWFMIVCSLTFEGTCDSIKKSKHVLQSKKFVQHKKL